MDGCGKFTTYAFVPYNEDSYQAYKAENGDDNWVVHGHDGAGAQATDCLGDWHYFEHFGQDIGSSTGGGCDMYAPYPGQDPLNQCYFSHPGKDTNFEWYNCGWWRGYTGDNGNDSGLYNSWNGIGQELLGFKVISVQLLQLTTAGLVFISGSTLLGLLQHMTPPWTGSGTAMIHKATISTAV